MGSANLLHFSSFLDPDCIPFELIVHGASEIAPSFHTVMEASNDPSTRSIVSSVTFAEVDGASVQQASDMPCREGCKHDKWIFAALLPSN